MLFLAQKLEKTKKAKIKSHEKKNSLAHRNLLKATYVLDIVSIHKIIKYKKKVYRLVLSLCGEFIWIRFMYL